MGPIIGGALLAGGASLVGGMINNASSAEQAHRNREFQQKMSSTAHQREVEDLRKAGLNPMLSAHGGASSPSGAVAQNQDVVSGAVNSGINAASQLKAMTLTEAQKNNVVANTALASANARKANVEANNIEQLQMQALQDQLNTYRMNVQSGKMQITDQRKAEQEIRNLEQQLKLLTSQTGQSAQQTRLLVEQTKSAKDEAAYGKYAPVVKPVKTGVDKIRHWWKEDGKYILKYGPNPKPEGRW